MIQALHRQGLSLRSIAAAVGCAHTTVFYELRRGTPDWKSKHGRAPQYMAKRGQKAYAENRRAPGNLVKSIMTTVSCLFNGWWNESARNAGHWMPALAIPGETSYLRQNRFPVPRRSTTCFGLTSFHCRSSRSRRS